MTKSRPVETAGETMAENIRTGIQEYTSAIRREIQGDFFKRDERMNHYDAMLQALTQLMMQQHSEVLAEIRAGLNGVTTELELLRQQVEALAQRLNEREVA